MTSNSSIGDIAQMVERSLSMREVSGSIPDISIFTIFFCIFNYLKYWFYRIHSIAPSLARILHEDVVIDNYLVPKGVNKTIQLYFIL